MSNTKALVTTDPQQFALAVTDLSELQEVIQENMGEGIPMKYERIKVPSGGGLAWQIPNDEGGKPTIAEAIEGVIIDHHPINAWWKEKFSGGGGKGKPPDCSSPDGITGIDQDGKQRPCATCPKNQFGTATDDKGNPTKGKACKNIRRVYIIPEGGIFPYLIPLPPGSLENFNDYIRRLTGKVKKFTAVKTKITLDSAENSTGIEFSKAVLGRVGDLDKESAKQMGELAKFMKPYLRKIGISDEDYNTGEETADSAAESVQDEGAGYSDHTGATIDVPAQPSTTGDDGGRAW